MEFHRIPLNSMKFHGNLLFHGKFHGTHGIPLHSMEFHGIFHRIFHGKFHGIKNSMEFMEFN
jgi:hypothetical protein